MHLYGGGPADGHTLSCRAAPHLVEVLGPSRALYVFTHRRDENVAMYRFLLDEPVS